jgi:hypothetical protein
MSLRNVETYPQFNLKLLLLDTAISKKRPKNLMCRLSVSYKNSKEDVIVITV